MQQLIMHLYYGDSPEAYPFIVQRAHNFQCKHLHILLQLPMKTCSYLEASCMAANLQSIENHLCVCAQGFTAVSANFFFNDGPVVTGGGLESVETTARVA